MARKVTSENLIERGKALAQRVDHQYFTRPHPWRRVMWILSISLPVIAGVATLIADKLPHGNRIYLPGPVSQKHALFGDRCDECHESGFNGWGRVSDSKCLACHDGPIHSLQTIHPSGNIQRVAVNGKMEQVSTPRCVTCHSEHKNRTLLADVNDNQCKQCHLDLQRADGQKPKVEAHVDSFEHDHPEWAVLREHRKDDTPFFLNHSVHTDVSIWPDDLKREGAMDRSVICAQCHVPNQTGMNFKPITYNEFCIRCHEMKKFAPAVEPFGKVVFNHGDPKRVTLEIRTAVSNWLLEHGGDPALLNVAKPKVSSDDDDGKPAVAIPVDNRTAEQWVHDKVAEVTKPLFFPEAKDKVTKSCLKCHMVESAGNDGIIEIPAKKIPTNWLPMARFNHHSHKVMDCLSCHKQARDSQFTSDVMLPGIADCRSCHSKAGGARADCVECHIYHDKNMENFTGQRSIGQLENGFQMNDKLEEHARTDAENDAIRQPILEAESKRIEALKAARKKWLEDSAKVLEKRAAEEKAKRKTVQPDVAPSVKQPDVIPVTPEVKTPNVTVVAPENKVPVMPRVNLPPTKCPNCGVVWPGGTQYCGRCGIKMPTVK